MVIEKKWPKKFRNKGASAIEFALVFPLLFLVMYALISYALIFAVQHTLSEAATEAARVAVRFTGKPTDNFALQRGQQGCDFVEGRVKWVKDIGGGAMECVVSDVVPTCPEVNAVRQCISVRFQYAYGANPFLPKLPLIPIPETIQGQAIAQLALQY